MQWGKLPDNSIQKKRSILRQVDNTISRQGRISVFGHFLVFLYVEWLVGFDALTPVQSYGIGLTLLLVAVWRLVYLLQFEHFYGRGPARWRNSYGLVTLVGAGLWSAYLTLTIVLPGYEGTMTFVWIYTAAVCATHIYIFAPYPKMADWYIRIMLIPPGIAGILQFELQYTTLGLAVLLFYAFMRSTGLQVSRQFWESQGNRQRLEYELGKASASEHQASLRADDSERFMANLTAMIKTPLNGVLGMLSLLSTAKLRQEETKLVEVASQSAHSLAELVDDFDTYLRVRGHFLSEEKKVFNVARHLESVMETLGPVAHGREVELSYTLKPDVPERVVGSPRQVTTLFKQLTTFAVSLSSGPEVSIKVQDASEGDGIDISVRFQADIEEQALEDMNTLLRSERGFESLGHIDVTMLSLVITSSLVRQHGGTLRLNVLDTEPPYRYQVNINLPLETSTQSGRVFQASRHFHGKTALLTGFPEYGGIAVAAELESWGMTVEQQALDESAVPDPSSGTIPDYWLINVPVVLGGPHLEVLQSIAEACKTEEKLRPMLMVTAAQQTLLSEWFEAEQMLSKPIPRRTLHRWLLRKPIDRQEEDDFEELSKRLSGQRVLVVDENQVNAMVARKILQRLGVEAVVVNSGKAARERYRKDSFDMIWVDQELSDMSGHEAVALLRNDEREEGGDAVVILGITTSRSPAVERNCMAAGMDDILEKPLNLAQVAETLQRHLV